MMAVVFSAFAGNAGWTIHHDRQDSLERRHALVRGMAALAAEHVHRIITTASVAMDQVAALVRDTPTLHAVHTIDHWKRLREHTAHLEGGDSLWVVDPDGKTILESASYPGRQAPIRDLSPYLTDPAPLSVGPALVERGEDGRVVYTLIRPLRDDSGRAVAAVIAVMNAPHLTRFHDLSVAGDAPLIGVYRPTGEVVSRRPNLPDMVGKSLADTPLFKDRLAGATEAVFVAPSPFDGVTRITALHRVGEQNLMVLVGLDPEPALADWRARGLRTFLAHLGGAFATLLAVAWWGRVPRPPVPPTEANPLPHPARDAQAMPPGTASDDAHSPDLSPETARRVLTILLVEEDPTIRRGVTALLRDWGHEVIEAADGQAALRQAEAANALDLLFTDALFTDTAIPPGMTGIDLASRIRQQRPHLPVLLASAPLANGEAADLDALPDTATIAKPYDIGALKTRIVQLCATDGA